MSWNWGEGGGRIGIAGPLPADGRIEDQVMRRVRNAVGSGVDELIVDVPAECIGLPLKRIDMETLGVVAVAFPRRRTGLLLAVEGVIVKRAVNGIWLVPQKLHDVDLTVPRALFRDHPLLTIRDGIRHEIFHWPIAVLRIKPMRRPETFSARQPGANLKSPVNRSQLPLGIDPPAGVMHRAVIPDPAPQTPAALLDIHVVRHIILELIVLAVLADEDIRSEEHTSEL